MGTEGCLHIQVKSNHSIAVSLKYRFKLIHRVLFSAIATPVRNL
jgi:hypothetical protein